MAPTSIAAAREAVLLPEELRSLFWDYRFEKLSWCADRDLITDRILSRGPWSAVRWLRDQLTDGELAAWIRRRDGRNLDPRRLRFWQLILDLPAADVDRWVARALADPWYRRAG